MLAREQTDCSPFGTLIILESDFAVDMDNLVVPSWHMTMVFSLGRVEIWRDISIFPLEDDKCLLCLGDQQPMHVVHERHVTNQPPLVRPIAEYGRRLVRR
jgi:hypothetical protein